MSGRFLQQTDAKPFRVLGSGEGFSRKRENLSLGQRIDRL
jgi:hypothetical protein